MEETPNKYTQALKESNVCADDAIVKSEVEKLLAEHVDENRNQEVFKFLLNCIDLTTLSSTDSEKSVAAFTQKVTNLKTPTRNTRTWLQSAYTRISQASSARTLK